MTFFRQVALEANFWHCYGDFSETKTAGNLIFSEVNDHLLTSKTKKNYKNRLSRTRLISIFLFETQRYKWRALHSYICIWVNCNFLVRLDFSCIFLITVFPVDQFGQFFYMLLAPKCPTATQNFSSLPHTIGDLWKIHCKKMSFFGDLHKEKRDFWLK